MILSRACQYGIRALLFLNARSPDGFVPVKEIAAETDIPVSFLAKVLGELVGHGLLDSMKGPGGGVRLAVPPSRIGLADVVAAIDGLDFMRRCVIGFPQCDSSTPCPLHASWTPLREAIFEMLSTKSLDQLMREMNGGDAEPGGVASTPRARRTEEGEGRREKVTP